MYIYIYIYIYTYIYICMVEQLLKLSLPAESQKTQLRTLSMSFFRVKCPEKVLVSSAKRRPWPWPSVKFWTAALSVRKSDPIASTTFNQSCQFMASHVQDHLQLTPGRRLGLRARPVVAWDTSQG